MRIVYDYDLALPCPLAAPIQILNTCRALAERGVSVIVHAGPIQGGVKECLAFYGLEPHDNLHLVARNPGAWTTSRVDPWNKADGGDVGTTVVISRGEPGLAVARRLRRRGLGLRFVYEAHRLCHTEVTARRAGRWITRDHIPGAVARLRNAERQAIEGADGLIALTEGVREAITACFRVVCPTLILPSGTACPPDEPPGGEGRDIDILYAGKIERRKGVFHLVEAMTHLPGRRLWIVGGSGDEVAALRSHAQAFGVVDRVEAVGFVPPTRIGGFLRRARVGVCPLPSGVSAISESYTSPLKILEMLAHGVPVVATDLPSTRAILEPDRSALLVEPNRPEALAGAIGRLLDDARLADRLRRHGRTLAEDYSWGRRADRLLDFLQGIAGELPS